MVGGERTFWEDGVAHIKGMKCMTENSQKPCLASSGTGDQWALSPERLWVVVDGDAECQAKELCSVGKHVFELGLRRKQSLQEARL